METYIFNAADSYEGLSPVTQAYTVCLDNEGQVLLQKHPERPWNIPGGKPEPGETYEEAAVREVYEESNVKIDHLVMIGYQKVFENGVFKSFQLRFLANVTAVDARQPDPDEGVLRERLFVPLADVMNYIPYPQYAELFKAVQAKLAKQAE